MFSFSYPIEDQYYCVPRPRITIPRLEDVSKPSLPMDLSELARMGEIPFLVNFLDGTRSPDAASFWLAYDDERVLLVGKMFAPTHGREDVLEDISQHDQIHIVFNPTPSMDRGYRVRLRPGTVVTIDCSGEQAPPVWWGEGGKIMHLIEEDGWSFALVIPFRLLGRSAPEKGEVWGMNLFRQPLKRQEDSSSWSVMYLGRTDVPQRYGEVVFGGDGPCAGIMRADIVPGESSASFWVRNVTDSAPILAVEGEDGEPLSRQPVIPGEFQEAAAHFELADGGSILLRLSDGTGRELARWPQNTGCDLLGPRIEALGDRLSQHLGCPSQRCRESAKLLSQRLERIKADASQGRKDAPRWAELAEEVRDMERRVSILEQRLGLANPDSPVSLLATDTLTKFAPAMPMAGVFKESASLVAPRGGTDSVQLLMVAYDIALDDCRVAFQCLVGPDGYTIGGEQVELRMVGLVTTRRPRYTVDHVGAHPDPLMPMEPFSVGVGQHQAIWLTVSIPPEAPAGEYHGKVEASCPGSLSLSVPVSLRVWDFTLPGRTSLRTAFPLFEREIEKFYGKPVGPEQRWLYYDFLLKRRISPSCQYEAEPRPRIEDLERVMSAGSNVISTGYLREEGDVEIWLAGVSGFVDHLRSRDLTKWAYVYGFDEVMPRDYKMLIASYGRIKEVYPDLPRACTIGPEHELDRLAGTVDIWIPQTDRFERSYKERQAHGDELWWYVSMWPRHPFANMFVDYPAMDHRILFWQTWKYGATGFLYYCINLWSSNCIGQPRLDWEVAALPDAADRKAIDSGVRWPQVPWNTYTGPTATNGDGQLIYPGPDGGPLSSVRLECIRHGIEDYEMLALLARYVEEAADRLPADLVDEARKLLEVPKELCRDLTHYSGDPQALLRVRAAVGDLIERLIRGLTSH
jgi:hypothetical protein